MTHGASDSAEAEPTGPGETRIGSKRRRSVRRVCVSIFLALLTLLIIAAILLPGYCFAPVRAKVQIGLNLANPARTSLAIACNEGTLHPSITHHDLGLSAPASYAGEYTQSIKVEGDGADAARVVIVMKRIGSGDNPPVKDGDTIVYTGVCVDNQVQWSVDGTIADRYKPRI